MLVGGGRLVPLSSKSMWLRTRLKIVFFCSLFHFVAGLKKNNFFIGEKHTVLTVYIFNQSQRHIVLFQLQNIENENRFVMEGGWSCVCLFVFYFVNYKFGSNYSEFKKNSGKNLNNYNAEWNDYIATWPMRQSK